MIWCQLSHTNNVKGHLRTKCEIGRKYIWWILFESAVVIAIRQEQLIYMKSFISLCQVLHTNVKDHFKSTLNVLHWNIQTADHLTDCYTTWGRNVHHIIHYLFIFFAPVFSAWVQYIPLWIEIQNMHYVTVSVWSCKTLFRDQDCSKINEDFYVTNFRNFTHRLQLSPSGLITWSRVLGSLLLPGFTA